jgi:branched-chain amino acid transport system ATP-binding protein
MHTSEATLALKNISVSYGPIKALSDVSLEIRQGEIVALVGSNGAGKSTLLRAISGLVPTQSGAIQLHGRDVTGAPAHRMARRGVAHVPEGRRVVAPLTVEENLLLGARSSRRRSSKDAVKFLDEMYDLFPRLRERRTQASGLLSGGEQQMLAIARGLMAKPEVLLLDEPSMGLAPIVVEEIYALLRDRPGYFAETCILLAEQSTTLAVSVADRAYVLVLGHLEYDGPAGELTEEIVQRAYFGTTSGPI